MGLFLDSRKATALSVGESVPSPKMPTLITPWGFSSLSLGQTVLGVVAGGDVAGSVEMF